MVVSDVELKYVDDQTALDLGRLAGAGIHGEALPFHTPWSRGSAVDVARNVYAYHSGLRSRFSVDDWSLEFAARLDGTLIGTQAFAAKRFTTTRSGESGSWLGRAYQGRGVGTLLRVAILSLAFDGLGAREVTTAAWADNSASNAVTRKLGYESNGEFVDDREGEATVLKRYRLDRTTWDARGDELRQHVHIEGLGPVRAWLGLDG